MTLSSQGSALIYVYELNTEFSGGAEPAGPSPWVSATFEDVNSNTVKLELSNFNLVGSEFIGGWYVNFNDNLNVNDLNFNRVGGTAVADPSISTGLNSRAISSKFS